jgi:hypothetical protein
MPRQRAVTLVGREAFKRQLPERCRDTPGPGAYPRSDSEHLWPHPRNIVLRGRPTQRVHANMTPGPAAYEVPDSLGAQPLSTKPSQPAVGFGIGSRFSGESKRATQDVGAYDIGDTLGRQWISTRKSVAPVTLKGRVPPPKPVYEARTAPGL